MLKILQVIDIYYLIIEIPYKRAYVIPMKEGTCRFFLNGTNNNVISTEGKKSIVICFTKIKTDSKILYFCNRNQLTAARH